MRRTLVSTTLLAACVILIALVYTRAEFFPVSAPQNSGSPSTRTVQVGGQTVVVFVVDTDAARAKGLGGRAGLARGEGMLFIFPRDGMYGFWMKDMHFAIDILWLADDPSSPSGQAVIVSMAQNVSPDTYPRDFLPSRPARYVLELPAGFTEEYTVKVGDLVRL